ncbi:hypothetical protein P7C70_g6799, partial [Phenoliferia sp. Uapishka_3]
MTNVFNAQSTSDEVAKHLADSIKGQVVLITGTTIGSLGFEAARTIAKHQPRLVVLVGRSEEKLSEAKEAIIKDNTNANVRLLVADFGSFASVSAAAKEVNSYSEPIDVFINNAAIAQPYSRTVDGYDLLLQTNYLSPFLFMHLIEPKLLASTSPARIVNVSSAAHAMSDVDIENFEKPDEKTYNKWVAYAQSKTLVQLFSLELKKRLESKGITVFTLHPGTIKTNYANEGTAEELKAIGLGHLLDADGNIGNNEHWKSLPQGAATHIVAAFDPALKSSNGAYIVDCNVANDQEADYAKDEKKALELWQKTEKILEKYW